MFENIFSKHKHSAEYKHITAEMIAHDNGLDYIPKVDVWARGDANGFYAKKGVYILLHPANDGEPNPPFSWYAGNGEFIIDNQHSFKNITNLSEILLQIIKLYTKYIDEDVFIESLGFAIKLEDEVHSNYHGKASLVLTKHSICNSKIKPEERSKIKKRFINDFLDYYIGLNFGVVIKNHPELESALIEFNELVIKKGLREHIRHDYDETYQSEDVVPYELKVE